MRHIRNNASDLCVEAVNSISKIRKQSMEIFIMVTLFLLSLSLLIILHEGGHFAAAKYFNTRVEKFFLFFDPKFALWSKKIGETEYGIGWLPLGGYVKIAGMIDESMDTEQMESEPEEWEYRSKPAWQRMIIILGGVIVNFILGFAIYAGLYYAYGEQFLSPDKATHGIYVDKVGEDLGLRDGDIITSVDGQALKSLDDRLLVRAIALDEAKNMQVKRQGRSIDLPIDEKWFSYFGKSENSGKPIFGVRFPMGVKTINSGPAKKAGVKNDDLIIAINDKSTNYVHEFLAEIQNHKAQDIKLTLLRNQRDTIVANLTTTPEAKIGIVLHGADNYLDFSTKEYGFFEAIPAGISRGVNMLAVQVKAFGQIFSGKRSAKESLGGPITIARVFPRTWDWRAFWELTALLSLILAFMNLLPIPALDGGHAVFILYEMITGKQPSDQFMQYSTMIGMGILLILMIFIFGLDISRLF